MGDIGLGTNIGSTPQTSPQTLHTDTGHDADIASAISAEESNPTESNQTTDHHHDDQIATEAYQNPEDIVTISQQASESEHSNADEAAAATGNQQPKHTTRLSTEKTDTQSSQKTEKIPGSLL